MNAKLLVFLTTILSSHSCISDTQRYDDVKSFAFFEQKIMEEQSSQSHILVVFDIDDTLLTSGSFVGGEVWYTWKSGDPVRHESGSTVTIDPADEPLCIFSDLGLFYEIGIYTPVESGVPGIVRRLQQSFDTLVITSRSPDYRTGTERELRRHNMDFAFEHFLPPPQTWSYSLGNRSISYEDGVIMSSGADKGRVLQDFLIKLDDAGQLTNSYSDVFFIDDGKRNIENMVRAFEDDMGTTAHLFHYSAASKIISDVDIEHSRSARVALNGFLEVAFPGRFELLKNGSCN